ncbi:MAG: hypothetical protein OSB41_02845 [Kiritimatiellae bacterium]|nr:hypothetical protein [Kiritimatiellia bacterium]
MPSVRRSKDTIIVLGDGEFILTRTTFECENLDRDLYRLNVLMNQGFRVYLNGHAIHTCGWWKTMPF